MKRRKREKERREDEKKDISRKDKERNHQCEIISVLLLLSATFSSPNIVSILMSNFIYGNGCGTILAQMNKKTKQLKLQR